MAADQQAGAERQAGHQAPRAKPAQSGLAQLARRISAWTSRGLVSAILLVAGLAFGRQVLHWWAAGTKDTTTAAPRLAVEGRLGDPRVEHTFQFGSGSWAMSRSTVVADASHVLAALRLRSREALRSAVLPAGNPGPAETGLLERLRGEKPVEEDAAAGWRVYQLDAAFPMVLGVRAPVRPSDHLPDRVADPGNRVVTWVVGVPAGPDAWTLYTFCCVPPKGGAIGGPGLWPVPPESRLSLAVQPVGGGALLALTGPDQPAAWKRFFDSWFDSHGWRMEGAWQERGSTWAAHCLGTGPEAAGSLDVYFGRTSRGELTGLVVITPPPGESTESEQR
jgi:hypothetical protein